MGAKGHPVELFALFEQFFLTNSRQLHTQHPQLQLIRLLLGVVVLPQLAGNGPQLLLEKIFTLVFINLRLGLLVDFVFHLQNLDFLRQHGNQLLHPLERPQLIQNELLALKINGDVRSNVVGQPAAVLFLQHP